MTNFSTKSKKELIEELQKQKQAYQQLEHEFESIKTNDLNFRNLTENMKDGLIIGSIDGKHLFTNKQAALLCGYTPQEMAQTTLKDLADPSALPLLKQRLLDRIEGRPVPATYETIIRRKDGSSFFAEVSGSKTLWEGKECDLVLFRDITERKKAERILKKHAIRLQAQLDLHQMSNEPFDKILDYALDACQKMTQSEFSFFCHVTANETALTIHRWSKGVLEQYQPSDLEALDFMVSETGLLCECIRTHKPVFVNDYSFNHPLIKGIPTGSIPITRMLAVPAIENGHVVAVISSANKEKDYTYDDAMGITSLLNKLMEIKKLQKVEEELRKSEAKFRLLFDASPDPITLSNTKGEFIDCNSATLQFHHLALKEELFSYQTKDTYANAEERQLVVEELLLKGKLRNREIRFKSLKGGFRDMLVSVELLKLKGDEPLFISWHRDVTELMQKERDLQASEERLRLSLESANQGLYDLNIQTGKAIVNEEYALMLGYDPETFVETNAAWMERLHPQDHEITAKAYKDYIEGRSEIYKIEFRQRTKQGDWKWILSMGKLVEYTADGKPLRMLGTHTDIHARKLMEIELKENEERYKESQQIGNVAHWEYNFETDKMKWSDQLYTIYDVPKNGFEPDFKNSLASVYPDDQEIIRSHYLKSIKNKEDFEVESRILTSKGQLKYLMNKAKLKLDENGNVKTILGTVTDITFRKEIENKLKEKNEQLNQLNATKDKFFTIIAHDLRSPFNTIAGFSELLLDLIKDKEYERMEEYAEIIHKTSEESVDLLQNLMDWARTQTGKIEYNPEYFNLVTYLSEAVKLFELVAKTKHIMIQLKLPHEAPVFADKTMVLTILRNLLFNAIKFTKNNGSIVLSVIDTTEGLLVSITDDGIGIAKNKLEKLFKLEENISTLGTNNEKGTGFGLLLCKEFVEKHGGTIWIESDEGKGSTIYFTLPHQP